MSILNRLKLTIQESRRLEDMEAKQAKMNADIEYIAIMSDIELDMDEEEFDNE